MIFMFPGTLPFQRVTRDLAEKREEELHNFLKQLLQGDPMVNVNLIRFMVYYQAPLSSDFKLILYLFELLFKYQAF